LVVVVVVTRRFERARLKQKTRHRRSAVTKSLEKGFHYD